jgi:ABC-type antimicrobial peptide transport system permease subunit
VAILSESLAGRLFKSADAIGGRIRIGDQPEHQNIEVLAIVGDANLWNIRAKRPATVYVPFFQEPQLMGRPVLEVQTLGDPKAVESNLLSSIQSLGHEYPFRTETIAESIQKSLVQERLAALLGKCLAGLAVFLAVIGVYGLFSYTVLLQTHDIGIRIALGASRRNVVRLILLDVLRIVPIGIGAGLAASAFLSRFITGLLLGLSPLDFASYLITTVLLVATAIVAAYIPARRASRIDPLLALRTE